MSAFIGDWFTRLVPRCSTIPINSLSDTALNLSSACVKQFVLLHYLQCFVNTSKQQGFRCFSSKLPESIRRVWDIAIGQCNFKLPTIVSFNAKSCSPQTCSVATGISVPGREHPQRNVPENTYRNGVIMFSVKYVITEYIIVTFRSFWLHLFCWTESYYVKTSLEARR